MLKMPPGRTLWYQSFLSGYGRFFFHFYPADLLYSSIFSSIWEFSLSPTIGFILCVKIDILWILRLNCMKWVFFAFFSRREGCIIEFHHALFLSWFILPLKDFRGLLGHPVTSYLRLNFERLQYICGHAYTTKNRVKSIFSVSFF